MLNPIRERLNQWPQALWGALLIALVLNLAYLLWPQPPETLVIRPHPETLASHKDISLPVLVAAPDSSAEKPAYLLLERELSASSGRPKFKATRLAQGGNARPEKKPLPRSPVNLNTATLEQLQSLPGVGEKTANRIMAFRRKIGQFSAVEQLLEVSGIGPKKLGQMAPYCRV